MVDTIYQIGKAISPGRDPWEDIIITVSTENYREGTRPIQLDLIFDLDSQTVSADFRELDGSFSEMRKMRLLKIRGGNNRAIYPSVRAHKTEQLNKTLFGKTGEEGELHLEIRTKFPEKTSSILYEVLEKIQSCQDSFLSWVAGPDSQKPDIRIISEKLGLGKNDKPEVVVAWVKWLEKDIPLMPLGQVEGFDELVSSVMLNDLAVAETEPRMDYVLGNPVSGTSVPKFFGRYNINKYFVQETTNFASLFNENHFGKNFSISPETTLYLDRGSAFLLEKFVVEIAGLRHVVIPQMLSTDAFRFDINELEAIGANAEMIFSLQRLKELDFSLKDQLDHYWLNFLAIDSDGNYFKAANLIKDVPFFHFRKVIQIFIQVSEKLKPWLGGNYMLNLGKMYGFIPVRAKQGKNPALLLFSALLEQRKIDRRNVFAHFNELILCHYYGRSRAYANLKEVKNFDFAARDAVFVYLAFIEVIHHLNLFYMEPMETTPVATSRGGQLAGEIEDFFKEFHYTEPQKALFFLGRALNQIAYWQKDKGHKKRVLEKLNYNGMEGNAILRLSTDLFDKARQYGKTDEIGWNLGHFTRRFNPNAWTMNSHEALFFILSGYTFGIKTSSSETIDNESVNE
ncbi:MAG: TM1802 family CRISPR-associated protein [Bacteroidia bacterium]